MWNKGVQDGKHRKRTVARGTTRVEVVETRRFRSGSWGDHVPMTRKMKRVRFNKAKELQLIFQKIREIFGVKCKYSERMRKANETLLCEHCLTQIKGRYSLIVDSDGGNWTYHKRCILSEMRDMIRIPNSLVKDSGVTEHRESIETNRQTPRLEQNDEVLNEGLECPECKELSMQEIVRKRTIEGIESLQHVWYRCLNPQCGYSKVV